MPPSASAEVRAPGKLVLLGEYAVLDGAPALVIAIDRGVRCQIFPHDAVLIETPDGDTRFVAPALQGAPAGRYVFSDWNPVEGLSGKPGFGGSAAACVAACVAAGRPATDAFAIHHAVQGGGSGIDVAASVLGGTLRFQAEHPPLACPPLAPLVIWSGQSARTGPRVQQYRAWSDPRARRRFQAASTALVEGYAADPVAAFAENAALLTDMAQHTGIAYWTPALRQIQGLAVAHGGAAKPSGAGGGDCAIAIFPGTQQKIAFVEDCDRLGWSLIEVHLASGAQRIAQ